VALAAAMITYGMDRHLVAKVAAISVGLVDGDALLDLDYSEDSRADVDFNVVGTDAGTFVEVQGTAEGRPFDRAAMEGLMDLATSGLDTLFAAQTEILATVKR
jgi:ribonuclease PH